MKSKNVSAAKKVNEVKTSKSAETKKEVAAINLQQFANKLQDVKIAEIRKKERLYIYPENFNDEKINGREGKAFRSKLRNKLETFSNNIFVYVKTNQTENLQKEVKSFLEFYKANYFINDFSVNSLTNKPEAKKDSLTLLLDIVKECNK